MRKSEVIPLFQMAYGDLAQLGDKGVDLIERDAAVLLPYGVDDNYKTELEGLTEQLKEFPTDEELQGNVTDLTETKDASADTVKVDIRSVMVRVKNRFGEKTGKYRMFGTAGMDEMTDSNLHKCGKRVVRMATKFLTQLASKGLTQGMIDDLALKVSTFDDDIDAQDDAIRARDNSTEDRLELGNELYNKIVELFDFGKDYWITRSESNYNDYVIYDTPAAGSNTVIKGNVDANKIFNAINSTNPKWVVGVSFKIKNTTPISVTNGMYFYTAANAGDGYTGQGSYIMPGQEETHTLTAADFKAFMNIQNPGPDAGSFEITIL